MRHLVVNQPSRLADMSGLASEGRRMIRGWGSAGVQLHHVSGSSHSLAKMASTFNLVIISKLCMLYIAI